LLSDSVFRLQKKQLHRPFLQLELQEEQLLIQYLWIISRIWPKGISQYDG